MEFEAIGRANLVYGAWNRNFEVNLYSLKNDDNAMTELVYVDNTANLIKDMIPKHQLVLVSERTGRIFHFTGTTRNGFLEFHIMKTTDRQPIAQRFSQCPLCNNEFEELPSVGKVHSCSDCGALFGTLDRDAILEHVNLDVVANEDEHDNDVDRNFFSFVYVTNNHNIHGWYDKSTKKVLQFG